MLGRALAAGYGVLALSMAMGLGFGFGVPMLPFLLVPRGKRESWTILLARWWATCVVRGVLLARPQITGSIDKDQGALIICNHRSWLDPLLLMAHSDSNGLSKRQILYIPFVGLFGWIAGAVFFDRSNRAQRARARREVMKLVASGFRIQLFPEGTRSRDGELREKVFLTLVRDCYDAGVLVVPAAVMDSDQVLPASHFGAYPGQRPRLHFCEPMDPSEFPDDETFAREAWARVAHQVEKMRAAPPSA